MQKKRCRNKLSLRTHMFVIGTLSNLKTCLFSKLFVYIQIEASFDLTCAYPPSWKRVVKVFKIIFGFNDVAEEVVSHK